MTHTDGAPAAQPSFQEFSAGNARTTSIVDVLGKDPRVIGG
ncbi:MAG TPA: hypothetical protein VII66_07500 [Gemmatimonadaceae bacterium]